jgi:hypothetical protein
VSLCDFHATLQWQQFNDAHASLRGFANSSLTSSVNVICGDEPRLYSYFENFDVFFPNSDNKLNKKLS